MPIRMLALPAVALILCSCATPGIPPSPSMCNVEAVKTFVGQSATADAVAAARRAAGAELVRVIKPGQAVTMDFRVERLNLYLNDAGAVERVSCG